MRDILFIHPDRKLIGIYKKHLGSHFKVDSAHDGLSGLRMIKLIKPQIIVSEYQLPFITGLDLLKYIRNHSEMYARPFLFLTNSEMPIEALGLGASAWLKQHDHGPEELMRKIYV